MVIVVVLLKGFDNWGCVILVFMNFGEYFFIVNVVVVFGIGCDVVCFFFYFCFFLCFDCVF